MNKKEILGLCEFLKLHGYENTDNISKFIFGLQQENKQLKEELKYTIGIVEHNRTISEKNEEIHQLKKQIKEYQKALDETMSEKTDIQNNWNKLKEFIVEEYYIYANAVYISIFLNEMQKLEQGSDSNE